MKSVKSLPGIIQMAFMLIFMLSLVACAPKQGFIFQPDKSLSVLLEKAPAYPEAQIVVMSDLHIYDTSLGTTGKAFEAYITADRKLVREGPEILDAAIGSIKNMTAGIVLVPGDLTKDGEKASHELAAGYLAQLKAAGKKVYVVPGNHDIKNGHTYKYVGDGVERVPNITAEQFTQIYADYGYKDALQRDTDSISYVAEPQPGLWLLALDSCRWKENVEDKETITDGKFSPQTLGWIEKMLGQAAKDNKAVIVMMHHGIMEHYVGQEKNYGEYIVDDAPEVARMLAAYNARLVLTGHYHAQDVTVKKWDDTKKFVFDIETGSLVTYPCPYRVINISTDQQALIKTELVTAIKSHPQDFPAFGKQYLLEGIAGIATTTLTGTYKVDRTEAEKISKEIAVAFAAHYAGDEKLAAGQQPVIESGLSPLAWVVIQMRKDLIIGLWNDLPPADNNITLNLKDGSWK
jgi:3',5'-cyclic AMP phosphodiesterase CpdA